MVWWEEDDGGAADKEMQRAGFRTQAIKRLVHVPYRCPEMAFMWPLVDEIVVRIFITVNYIGDDGKVKSRMPLVLTHPIVVRLPIEDRLPAFPRWKRTVVEDDRLADCKG